MGASVVVIDNYDSFVYNLVQYLGELGADPVVHRHDDLTIDEIAALDPDGVLISPGPGRPELTEVLDEVVDEAVVGVEHEDPGHADEPTGHPPAEAPRFGCEP